MTRVDPAPAAEPAAAHDGARRHALALPVAVYGGALRSRAAKRSGLAQAHTFQESSCLMGADPVLLQSFA